jgi:hypothetical protein
LFHKDNLGFSNFSFGKPLPIIGLKEWLGNVKRIIYPKPFHPPYPSALGYSAKQALIVTYTWGRVKNAGIECKQH